MQDVFKAFCVDHILVKRGSTERRRQNMFVPTR